MPRTRTRPTRLDTQQRLFEAAARLFALRGIGGASIDAIVTAAGFSRGAFYSNFQTKEDLIIAMLQDHAARSLEHYRQVLLEHPDPADFVAALGAAERSQRDPIGRAPLLHIELILFVARAGTRRPDLAARLRARRELIAEMIRAVHPDGAVDPNWGAALLLALEDGFRLHQLIDPDTTPADSFVHAVAELQRMVGMRAEKT